jgi:hypothetical protein
MDTGHSVEAMGINGVIGAIDVTDLREDSFRAWVIDQLFGNHPRIYHGMVGVPLNEATRPVVETNLPNPKVETNLPDVDLGPSPLVETVDAMRSVRTGVEVRLLKSIAAGHVERFRPEQLSITKVYWVAVLHALDWAYDKDAPQPTEDVQKWSS